MHRVSDQESPGPSHHYDPLAVFYEHMYNLVFVQNKAITRFSNHFNSKHTMQMEENEFKTVTVLMTFTKWESKFSSVAHINLFVYCLFSDAFKSSHYNTSNDSISERFGKGLETSRCGLIWHIILTCTRRHWGKPWKNTQSLDQNLSQGAPKDDVKCYPLKWDNAVCQAKQKVLYFQNYKQKGTN